jgi:hypothetical protein
MGYFLPMWAGQPFLMSPHPPPCVHSFVALHAIWKPRGILKPRAITTSALERVFKSTMYSTSILFSKPLVKTREIANFGSNMNKTIDSETS